MDTKWKKSKVIISFVAFATGLTMLVIHLMSAAALFVAYGEKVFEGPLDYQENGEFRWIISNRLSDLLGVATGGHTYAKSGYVTDATGAQYKYMDESYQEWTDRLLNESSEVQEEAVIEQSASTAYNSAVSKELGLADLADFGGNVDDYLAYLEELRANQYEQMLNEYGLAAGGYGWADDSSYYTYGSDSYLYADEKSFMADMAKNLNLRYAVIYQNKLLYSNIEAYEDKAGQVWDGEDYAKALDAKAYNFTLWFNKEGDGKVEIVKDGRKEDVYGDGLYTDASRWQVPGYANYKLGDKARDAVIFLAAAKNPQRYLVANEKGSGYESYGGNLYRLKTNMDYLQYQAEWTRKFLGAAAVLLFIAFLMRKSRKQAAERIGGFLGKLCLEIKLALFVILFLAVAVKGWGAFGEAVWYFGTSGFGYYNWDVYLGGDIAWQYTRIVMSGVYLAIFFWLIYLAALDVRYNGKTQKKPLIDLLKIKDLKYPIQKRLVRRQRLTLIAELVLLMLFAAAFVLYALVAGNPETADMMYNAGLGQIYETAVVEAAEYGLSAWSVGSPFLLVMEVVFAILAVFTALTVWGLKKNRRLAMDIGALSDQILAVREGNLTGELTLSEDTDLREAADNLNQIQKGLETALTEQVNSERMKVELVTNVSHDIKTPLTSIISYVELLRQEQDLPQHVKEYVQILGEKSERLKNIVQDVFEVSKAASGQLPMQMEVLDLSKLLRQTLADMNDQISQSTLVMRTMVPEEPVSVLADGQRLYRVFQNLLQNALHYSLEGSRVYLTLAEEGGQAVVRVKNTSSVELTNSKDFTERFVRGDESRTDGGSGLGLSIAKSFTEACGGKLTVETDADLFTATVRFDRAESAHGREKDTLFEASASAPGMTGGKEPIAPEEVESV